MKPATYTMHMGGCAHGDQPVSWDPLVQRADGGVTRLPDGGYEIRGWAPGSGGVYATRTIHLNDGSITLEIDSAP